MNIQSMVHTHYELSIIGKRIDYLFNTNKAAKEALLSFSRSEYEDLTILVYDYSDVSIGVVGDDNVVKPADSARYRALCELEHMIVQLIAY